VLKLVRAYNIYMHKDMLTNQNKDHSGGFTLLGTLFSSFLAIIVIAAIASLSAQVYGSSRNSRDRFIAVGLAKEGIELVRNIRDGNWLFYEYDTTSGSSLPTTKMWWRGDNSGTLYPADESHLRDICDSGTDYYTVDGAPGVDLGLKAVSTVDGEKLYLDSDGYYTHNTTTQSTIFSRKIFINTDTTGGLSSACGQEAESVLVAPATTLEKPAPIIVTSTVLWEDSVGATHTVVLQESLYDWITQRP